MYVDNEKARTIKINLKAASKRPVTFSLELSVDYELEHRTHRSQVYEAFLPKLMALLEDESVID